MSWLTQERSTCDFHRTSNKPTIRSIYIRIKREVPVSRTRNHLLHAASKHGGTWLQRRDTAWCEIYPRQTGWLVGPSRCVRDGVNQDLCEPNSFVVFCLWQAIRKGREEESSQHAARDTEKEVQNKESPDMRWRSFITGIQIPEMFWTHLLWSEYI